MLKKLLKYDIKDIYKVLIYFYLLAIFSSIITRILFSIENSTIFNILAQISSGFTIAMIANILINNLMRIWVRFKNNFYNDEAYLTHTLPVSKNNLYLSKFLAQITTIFTSILIIIITLFIAYYSKENIEILKNILLPIANVYNSTIINIILIIFIVFFLQFNTIIQSGIFGIIVGHTKNKNKLFYSIIFGFICYIIIQIISLFTIFIAGIFNNNIMELFFTNTIESFETLKIIMYIISIMYLLIITLLYCINNKIFKQGVNID